MQMKTTTTLVRRKLGGGRWPDILSRDITVFNTDIDSYLKRSRIYLGCFKEDHLPTFIPYHKRRLLMVLLNSDHWVLLHFDKRTGPVFFDSLCGGIPVKLIHFIKRFDRRPIQYNIRPVQDTRSFTCGYHVLFVARHLEEGESVHTITCNYYTLNVISNDLNVLEWV